MKVYAAINAVQRALSVTGIAKARKNTQGAGYMFRGIDDVYQAIAPLLAEHALCIIPRMIARTSEERQSKAGGALFYVTVEAEFDFVSAEDGSKHTARTFGEAMDSGDKATNKAMSAAYKYAAFQTFAIPTEGNSDADAEIHQVALKPVQISPTRETAAATPITSEEASYVMDVGGEMVAAFGSGREMDALKLWRGISDNDIKIHLWNWLQSESKLRSFLKANKE